MCSECVSGYYVSNGNCYLCSIRAPQPACQNNTNKNNDNPHKGLIGGIIAGVAGLFAISFITNRCIRRRIIAKRVLAAQQGQNGVAVQQSDEQVNYNQMGGVNSNMGLNNNSNYPYYNQVSNPAYNNSPNVQENPSKSDHISNQQNQNVAPAEYQQNNHSQLEIDVNRSQNNINDLPNPTPANFEGKLSL